MSDDRPLILCANDDGFFSKGLRAVAGLEHPVPSPVGRANRLEHDRRLADAGLALEQERDWPVRHALHEARNRRRLVCAPDHVDHRRTLVVDAGETTTADHAVA